MFCMREIRRRVGYEMDVCLGALHTRKLILRVAAESAI